MKITLDMLDELVVPEHIVRELVARYMEYVTEPEPFVIQRHSIGKSNHGDFRLKVDSYLVGWSIVGFSEDDPFSIEKLLENMGKGFRAETKARQPLVWLKVEGDIPPGEVGAGEEAPGKFEILTSGKHLTGAQKPYFHEYFLKDNKYFKDWTRVVVRGIKVAKIDPKSKKPIPGEYERMWRLMIPKTQMPYTISNRAMKENWKPPKECPFPFPRDWVKENFPDQYRKWLQWITKSDEEDISKLEKLYLKKKDELLSKNIKFALALASWMGCVSKDSWLLSIDGFKQAKDLKEGDYLLNNPFVKIKKITNIGKSQGVRIQTYHGIPIVLSLNHPILVNHTSYKNNAKIKAWKLKNPLNPKWRPAGSLVKNDIVLMPKIHFETKYYGSYDEGRLYGFFLGDGSRAFWKNRYRTKDGQEKIYLIEQHIAYFNRYKEKDLLEEYRELAKQVLGSKGSVFDDVGAGTLNWKLSGSRRKSFFEKIYTPNNEKIIPREFLFYNREFKLGLIQGLLDSDHGGGKKRGQKSISISSPQIMGMVFLILLDLGIIPSCYFNKNGQIEVYWREDKVKKGVFDYGNYLGFLVRKVEPVDEAEFINIETVNGTFGVPMMLTHNSRAKSGRQMPQFRWYLLLDDKGKGKVRTFFLDGFPLREDIMGAYEMDRSDRKWLGYSGKTEPGSQFNPNKELVGQYTIIDKGMVSYESSMVDGEEHITLKFKGKKLKGEWTLIQEEKGADVYTFEKLSEHELSELASGKFVLDIHEFPEGSGKRHLDLRFHIPGESFLREFNLFTTDEIWEYPEEKPVQARLKQCEDLEWMKVKPKGTRMKAYGKWSIVETIDHGDIEIIEENPNFISMTIKGKKLNGYYIARKVNHLWQFMKSKLPSPLCSADYIFYYQLSKEGDPRAGVPYKDFVIEQKRGWDHFIVHIYDLRKFTRVEPDEKVKDYLPELEIPAGVQIGIGLFPVPGKIHHARVAYVVFDSDKWTYDRAIDWIKKNKLDQFIRTQIRKRRSS